VNIYTRTIMCGSLAAVLVACGGDRAAPRGASRAPAAPAVAAPVTPVPETLAFEAGRFGLTMTAEGWTWKVLRRNLTRFDWSGRPANGDRELLYSFFMDKVDERSAKLLPQVVASAAANLSDKETCPPVEQPPAIVHALGVDRVISVCFAPSTFYATEHKSGVLHGIVHDGALTIAVVLSNDRAALAAPLPVAIGAHGTATSR
jgi:hypothetical protein